MITEHKFKDMKYNKIIHVLILFSLTLFVGCAEEDVPVPGSCFTINNSTGNNITEKAGKSIVFAGCSEADSYVVWTGDLKHNYDTRAENLTEVDQEKTVTSDFGFVADVKTKSYTYTYNVAGTYTVTWITCNVGNDGDQLVFSKSSKLITIE